MWAVSNLIARLASRVADYEPFPFIVWSSLFPVVPFLALAAWAHRPSAGWRHLMGMDGRAWLAVLFLAWLATLLAYSLWTLLLKRHPAGRVTPFSLLVPVVGLWAAWAFSGELPQRWQWAGTAAVMLGLVINQAGPLRALVKGIAERRR
jgi:O-acetylserine/cysteine efflux transporter